MPIAPFVRINSFPGKYPSRVLRKRSTRPAPRRSERISQKVRRDLFFFRDVLYHRELGPPVGLPG